MTSAIRYRYSTEGTKREMEMYKHDVISHLPAISIHGYVGGGQIYALWLFMGVRVHVANFYTDQSIGIDETNTFQIVMGVRVGVAIFFFMGVRVGVANLFLNPS